MVDANTILERLRAAGIAAELLGDGRILTHGRRVPDDLRPLLREHRGAVADELRRRAESTSGPAPTTVPVADDHAAELAACAREAKLLGRVSTGLGREVDAHLWRALDVALAARDLPLADRLWQHVVDADRRGILSRLASWIAALDHAGNDLKAVRSLAELGPGHHHFHDAAPIARDGTRRVQ